MGNTEIDTLNSALERLLAGESPPEIVQGLAEQGASVAPLLEVGRNLSFLSHAPLPPPEQVKVDRAVFLQQVAETQLPAVSLSFLDRLKEWVMPSKRQPGISETGGKRMWQELLVKAAMIMTMVLGSTGASAVMAKDSLPGTWLYPLKMAMEQGQESIITNPAERANYELTRAQNRLQELARLMEGAGDADSQTTLAAQVHFENSLQLAAGLSDEEMIPLLERIRQMTSEQLQQWSRYENDGSQSIQQQARLVVQVLNRIRTQAEEGLNDPQEWRLRLRNGQPAATPEPAPTPTPEVTEEPGGVISGTLQSECDSADCEPIGDQNMYGPQPDQPGPGQPGGNPDGTCVNGDDCVPDGDKNQYGRQDETTSSSGNDCTTTGCGQEGNQDQSSSSSVSSCENGNCQQQDFSSSSSAGSDDQGGNSSSSSSSEVQSSQDNGDHGGSSDSNDSGSSNGGSSDGGSSDGGSSDGGSSPKSVSDKGGKGK